MSHSIALPTGTTLSGVVLALALVVPAWAAEDGRSISKKDDGWFSTAEGRSILANMLTYQTAAGGWGKGYDAKTPRDPAAGASGFGDWGGTPTIDNGATYSEIRACARAYRLGGRPEFLEAAQRGIDFLLARQYPNGGWPQCSPIDNPRIDDYHFLITFNDNAMTYVMDLLEEIADVERPEFAGFDDARRATCREAFDRGVDCILACQIEVDGRPTGWCQQHDARTLEPASARAYELPSIAGAESAKVALLLIEIEDPSPEVRQAIEAAHAWFESSKIVDKTLATTDGPIPPGGNAKALVDAPGSVLWARMVDIETNQPIFVDRDGVKRSTIGAISKERAGGYDWYGSWGLDVEKRFERWKKTHAAPAG